MKKYITAIILLSLVRPAMASTFYDQLYAFNFNWSKYKDRVPENKAQIFSSDRQYIQAHLTSVLFILRTNPTNQLNSTQLKSRINMIRILDSYRIAGIFPVNYDNIQRIPVFIDRHRTHCAVAYLLQQTGQEFLANQIAAKNNYAWVKDINVPGLFKWQLSSGLSLEELKLIQGAYDYYMPNAFELPNKYEIPQKPACITAYFDSKAGEKIKHRDPANIWCRGEGANGILNGRWEQNFEKGMPWIIGYFNNGNRTGQWYEYYQGTNILCRTENWRNDKLNGIRKRFDRSGKLVEEILFKDGNAVTKTNYNFSDSVVSVRTPLDSITVKTSIYTFGGGLLATGVEKIYNPDNLLWFQNIELTALNAAAITSREVSLYNSISQDRNIHISKPQAMRMLYNAPALVEYKKEGMWTYYQEHRNNIASPVLNRSLQVLLKEDFQHFAADMFKFLHHFQELKITAGYDSLTVLYSNDLMQDFYAVGSKDFNHLRFRYFDADVSTDQISLRRFSSKSYRNYYKFKEVGQYDRSEQRIGTWKYFNRAQTIYKTENYLLPQQEKEQSHNMNSTMPVNAILNRSPHSKDLKGK